MAASSSAPEYPPDKPEPVLWFPGGDAECGTNAGSKERHALLCDNNTDITFHLSANYDISTFSIIALMLSIFNIVDLVVSNANNNNNRNNINDNTQNINDNSNTESNANAGQSSANQVMMVPPGVGRRRKREVNGTEVFLLPLFVQQKFYLIFQSSVPVNLLMMDEVDDRMFRIVIKTSQTDGVGLFNSSWYSISSNLSRLEVEDESMLAMSAVNNAWHLLQASPAHCHVRNFCELGFNGSVWGDLGALVVEMMGKIIIRFVSLDMEEEAQLYNALRYVNKSVLKTKELFVVKIFLQAWAGFGSAIQRRRDGRNV